MKARCYLVRDGDGEWCETEVINPPLPELRIPVMTADGYGQLILRLVAVEHDLAVYISKDKEAEHA